MIIYWVPSKTHSKKKMPWFQAAYLFCCRCACRWLDFNFCLWRIGWTVLIIVRGKLADWARGSARADSGQFQHFKHQGSGSPRGWTAFSAASFSQGGNSIRAPCKNLWCFIHGSCANVQANLAAWHKMSTFARCSDFLTKVHNFWNSRSHYLNKSREI